MWHLNNSRLLQRCFQLFNRILVPYQCWLYTRVYGQALKKWPHLRLEILCGADYSELLNKYGVHRVRTGPNSYEIRYDWNENNYVRPEIEEEENSDE